MKARGDALTIEGKLFPLPSKNHHIIMNEEQQAHMDGILGFAVCIWSWLLVLGTRPMGREIAYKKIQKWNRWDDRIRTDLLWRRLECARGPEQVCLR